MGRKFYLSTSEVLDIRSTHNDTVVLGLVKYCSVAETLTDVSNLVCKVLFLFNRNVFSSQLFFNLKNIYPRHIYIGVLIFFSVTADVQWSLL